MMELSHLINNKIKNINLPKEGYFSHIFEDLYWGRLKLPFRLNHINIFIIEKKNGLILIDCGLKNLVTKKAWGKLLSNLPNGKKIEKIIISHHHPDHLGCAKMLSKELDIQVYMAKKELERSAFLFSLSNIKYSNLMTTVYKSFGFPDKTISEFLKEGNYYKKLLNEIPNLKQLNFKKILTEYGEWKIRLDKGHSPSHISFSDEKRKVYICIDFLLPKITPNISVEIDNINENILQNYLEYLHEMKNIPNDWLIVPGHEEPYYGGGERAKKIIDHHTGRLERLKNLCSKNYINTVEAMNKLFGRLKNNHDIFFAICETRAHLNFLVNKGEVIKRENSNGIDEFTKINAIKSKH